MLVSMTGSQMQNVAIDWHVYLLTHSPLALGFIGLTRVVPIVAFSMGGGLVADRRDRRRVMLVTQSCMTAVAVTLAVLTFHGLENVWLLYALTACQSAAGAFDAPSRQSLLPRLVPLDELPGGLAVMLTMFQLAAIGGPALAGLLIAGASGIVGSIGPSSGHALSASTRSLFLIYAINAVSFLAVIGALLAMKTSGGPAQGAEAPEPPLRALKEGLRFVFSTPVMVGTMTLDFVATFFSGSMSLLPIFADQVLKAGPAGYGWLRAATGIGAVLGSLYTSLRSLPPRQGRVFLWAVAAYGAATVAFGFSRSFWLTFLALALVGLSDTISTVVRQTVRQLVTPDALRGRMTGVNMIFFMGGPQLGELEAGFVASLFASAALGATVAVVAGGIATIAVTGVVAMIWPIIRDYDVHTEVNT
jgi:MFS family permease